LRQERRKAATFARFCDEIVEKRLNLCGFAMRASKAVYVCVVLCLERQKASKLARFRDEGAEKRLDLRGFVMRASKGVYICPVLR
jgi:hypothetical protein